MLYSTVIADAPTIDRVAEIINDGGVASMGEDFSADYCAGQYIYDAACASAEVINDTAGIADLDENDFDAHAEYLIEAGADFDRWKAGRVAMSFRDEAVSDLHSADA